MSFGLVGFHHNIPVQSCGFDDGRSFFHIDYGLTQAVKVDEHVRRSNVVGNRDTVTSSLCGELQLMRYCPLYLGMSV